MSRIEPIVRTPTKAAGGITPAERGAMEAYAQKWIAIAMRTGPTDRAALTDAIARLYAAAGLKRPRIIIVPSPIVMAFAGGIGSAWWSRGSRPSTHSAALAELDSAAIYTTRRETAVAALTEAHEAMTQADRADIDRIATEASAKIGEVYRAAFVATFAATEAATKNEKFSSVRDAVASVAFTAIYKATEAAMRTFTSVATCVSTYTKVRAIARRSVEEVVDAATRGVKRSVTAATARAAAPFINTRSKMDAATESEMFRATFVAVLAATHGAAELALGAAMRNATAAMRKATTGAPNWALEIARHILGKDAERGMKCAADWFNYCHGGNMWAAQCAYLGACRDILGLRLKGHEAYRAWEDAATHGGFRWMHEEFCMVCELPVALLTDELHRPHCENGPSHEWPDGWKLYHIHGVAVPEFVVMRPESITMKHIMAEENAEVRRVMIERYGEPRYIEDSGMKPVAHDDTFGTIYFEATNAGRPIARLKVVNRTAEPDGSFRAYWLPINPEHYNGLAGRIPQAAAASTWRTTPGGSELFFKNWRDYRPAIET